MGREGQADKGRGAEERGRDRAGVQAQDYEGAQPPPPPAVLWDRGECRERRVEHGEAKCPQESRCGGR